MNNTTRIIAGAALALAVAPAFAGLTFNPSPDPTILQDDNLDFHLRWDPISQSLVAANDTQIIGRDTSPTGVGDVLVAVLDYETSAGVPIAPDELTGVTVIEAIGVTTVGGLNVFTFAPYQFGFNAAIASTGVSVGASGDAGGGAMLALWLDDSPDLSIDAGLIPSGLSCYSLPACLAQATDGDLWEVDGIDLMTDYWYAVATEGNPQTILTSSPGQTFGFFNAGLSILWQDPSVVGAEMQPGLLTGDNTGNGGQPVDVLFTGNLLGGGCENLAACAALQGLIDDGYVAASDTDTTKVPVPAPLALLAAGLLGLGLARRRLA